MFPGGYTAEVTGLLPITTQKDLFEFFYHCGDIEHIEIVRCGEAAHTAYITFKDAYALETAVLLSGATIAEQGVRISRWGTNRNELDQWDDNHQEMVTYVNSLAVSHANQFISTPGEAVTVAQQLVHTMISKGYVLSKDALIKAKAFDDSHRVSATAAAKLAEFSKSAAMFTGRTAVTAATAVVNSSYFAKGALWISDVLDRASKYAAELGNKNSKEESSDSVIL